MLSIYHLSIYRTFKKVVGHGFFPLAVKVIIAKIGGKISLLLTI